MKKINLLYSAALALIWAAPGQAEQASDPQEGASRSGAAFEQLDEIVVTGSRIARRDYDSDSPIVTVGAAELSAAGAVSVQTLINQLPQAVAGQGEATSFNGGLATLNLRGLGEQRNLVLLDGHRLPPANANGVINLNIIPVGIVEDIEVITGGASSTYGSDAISGVLNFKSRKNFRGVEIDGQYNNSFKTDLAKSNINLTMGIGDRENRAHALVSLGYFSRGSLYGRERRFFRNGFLSGFLGQGTFTPTGGNLPTQEAVNSVFAGYGVAGNTVLNTQNLGFNDDGTLFRQIGPVNYRGPIDPDYATLGGSLRESILGPSTLIQPEKRYSAFVNFGYDLTDDVEVYGQMLYIEDKVTSGLGFSASVQLTPSAPASNPFIPADLRTLLASRPNPNADFIPGIRFKGPPARYSRSDNQTSQILLGARGKVPGTPFTFDIYASRGLTEAQDTLGNSILYSRVRNLLYAPDGGVSICRGGLNIFGLSNNLSLSPECAAYIAEDLKNSTRVLDKTIEATVQGPLFAFNGEEVKFALTADYRQNSFASDPDARITAADVYATLTTSPTSGKRDVWEISGELAIPLLRDLPLVKSFDVNLGYRYSRYQLSGSASTYKISGEWKPVSALLIRGGFERAIRAPNLSELFSPPSSQFVQIGNPPVAGDPCDTRSAVRSGANGAQVRDLCLGTGLAPSNVDAFNFVTSTVIGSVSGSTALSPEKADTYTIGAVLRPQGGDPLFSGLMLSVDYYDIKVDRVISPLSGNTVINKCYNLDGSNPTYSAANPFCTLISRDTTGQIVTIRTPYQNLGGLKTRGIDAQLSWSLPLDEIGMTKRNGRILLNSNLNVVSSYKIATLPGQAFQDFAGTIDGGAPSSYTLVLPKWRLLTTLGYEESGFGINLRWSHIPAIRDVSSVTRPGSPAPGVRAHDVFDLTGSVKVLDNVRLRGGITNLFDRDPPVVAGTTGLTQGNTYDIVGRSFFIGAKIGF